MARKGILLGDDGDLIAQNGTLVIGDSDDQNVSFNISTTKGSVKEYPIGVGIINYLKKQNSSIEELKRDIVVNLTADNYKVNKLEFDNKGNFNLDYELKS